jgi:beta-1,4-N-acetylglucosaminyltransferase
MREGQEFSNKTHCANMSSASSLSQGRTALLTVGSTQFDNLVTSALNPLSLEALYTRGITRFIVQYGTGDIRYILRLVALQPEDGFPSPSTTSDGAAEVITIKTSQGVQVEMYAFMDDIEERMMDADLVLSHAGVLFFAISVIAKLIVLLAAGAGSILAALRGPALRPSTEAQQQKQLIIVPNDSLMDSHQSELAIEIAKNDWASVATPE